MKQMRFGLFVMGTEGGDYAAILDQCVRAEQFGFDAVVLAERHFRHADLLLPSPLEFGAAIAARTERVRIGTAGRILSLDHPIHIAEAVATLDVLSGGRVDFGITRASLDAEAHQAFDSPEGISEPLFLEALEVIEAAWTHDSFSYGGKHFTLEEISVQPKPLQSPHPPIYLVAVSPRRLAFAAARGLNVYFGAIRTVRELEETATRYRSGLEAAGHDPLRTSMSINRFVYVADSDEQAVAEFEGPLMRLMRDRAPDLKAALVAKYGVEGLTYERFLADFAVVGSAESVAARLAEVIDTTACDYLLLTANFVTMPHQRCLRSMELLAGAVLPALGQQAPETA